jgi:hypothetical protein
VRKGKGRERKGKERSGQVRDRHGCQGGAGRSGKEREGRSGRSGMGGIQNDPPSDGASAMAWGDCCLHALLNLDLAGEAVATVVSAAAEVAAAWWEK